MNLNKPFRENGATEMSLLTFSFSLISCLRSLLVFTEFEGFFLSLSTSLAMEIKLQPYFTINRETLLFLKPRYHKESKQLYFVSVPNFITRSQPLLQGCAIGRIYNSSLAKR